jgi:hypothetical protein
VLTDELGLNADSGTSGCSAVRSRMGERQLDVSPDDAFLKCPQPSASSAAWDVAQEASSWSRSAEAEPGSAVMASYS